MGDNHDSFPRLWLLHHNNKFDWCSLYIYIDHLFRFSSYLSYGHDLHVAERKEKCTVVVVIIETCISVIRLNREEKTLAAMNQNSL
jgi:hypothetical protein